MRLGFVGLGNMGAPMVGNLLEAGHELVVHDVRSEAVAPLEAQGAVPAPSPAAVTAAGVEAVLLSLPTPPIVETVVTGDDGVLAGSTAGSVIIDLSTNSPTLVRDLARQADDRGVAFLDAPVSGGIRGARKGTLAVMVGGTEELFERFRPVWDAIGLHAFHVGDVGAGNVAKLVNNQLALVNMLATTEALVLGVKAGLDPMALRNVVLASSGASFAFDNGSRAILRDRLQPTFSTSLARKDVGLAQQLADELGVPSPVGAEGLRLLEALCEAGYADEDILATVRSIEDRAGQVVRGTWQDDS